MSLKLNTAASLAGYTPLRYGLRQKASRHRRSGTYRVQEQSVMDGLSAELIAPVKSLTCTLMYIFSPIILTLCWQKKPSTIRRWQRDP